MLNSTIPAGVNAGQSADIFGNAVATLNSYDPNGVFSEHFPEDLAVLTVFTGSGRREALPRRPLWRLGAR